MRGGFRGRLWRISSERHKTPVPFRAHLVDVDTACTIAVRIADLAVNPFMPLESLYLREFVRQLAKGEHKLSVRTAFERTFVYFDSDVALHGSIRRAAAPASFIAASKVQLA